ncbi:MAG TPA: phosphoglucosamine mutase [Acidimicrobiales bacterium]
MTLRFGTDGLRGLANAELSPELALALGRAAARTFPPGPVLIGRDTRRSGPMLESALAAGFASEGRRVELAGVVPTPAVAYLSATDGGVGAMISGSHNPFPDNGIKLFLPGGRKLTDEIEERLEAQVDAILGGAVTEPLVGAGVGAVTSVHDRIEGYIASVVSSLDGRRLDGLEVVVDVGHGAAIEAAPAVLRRLGAHVTVLNDAPDGTNINDGCGSTDPAALARSVTDLGAHGGLAFDGDADRLIAVDETGAVVDGDQIIAVCAVDLYERGLLRENTVVVTVMSNLGFRLAMEQHGLAVVETAVGDRYVLDALEDRQLSLGGEQSGHVIFTDHATTGDGLLTGVQLLDAVARSRQPLSDLAGVVQRVPQVLTNVPVTGDAARIVDQMADAVDQVAVSLGESGRVLVRASGTEPVVRVMVEAVDADVAERTAATLARLVLDTAG